MPEPPTGTCCFCARERPATNLRFIPGSRVMCTDSPECSTAHEAAIERGRRARQARRRKGTVNYLDHTRHPRGYRT